MQSNAVQIVTMICTLFTTITLLVVAPLVRGILKRWDQDLLERQAKAETDRLAALEIKKAAEAVAVALRVANEEANRRAEESKAAAEQVASVLKATTDSSDARIEKLTKVTNDTHTLVNSNMGVQLRLNKVVTRRLANLTKDTPEGEADEKAAALAESMLSEHEAKQAIVDAQIVGPT